ncbi:MAG: hypothetical protein EOP21_08350, partial [Hyphomicrobiales bacterium]
MTGIDLGTTNSFVSVWRDGVELIPDALGEAVAPSVVSLNRGSSHPGGRGTLPRMQTTRTNRFLPGPSPVLRFTGWT